MLVLSRHVGERIRIGPSITIVPTRISAGAVRLGIIAPQSMNIVREELGPLREIRERVEPMIAESPMAADEVAVPAPSRVSTFGPPASSIRPLAPGYTVRQLPTSPPAGVCFWHPDNGYWFSTFVPSTDRDSRVECMTLTLTVARVMDDTNAGEVRVVTFQEVSSDGDKI